MRTSIKSTLSILTIAVSAALLSACGGGGSSNNSGGNPQPGFTPKSVSGTAIDLYVSGATVTFDDCNGATATTDSNGKFTFTTTEACQNSSITIKGGTDTGTGLPFTGTLKLKDTSLQNLSNPSITITPLTSLEAVLIENNQQSLLPTILANLGIPSDIDVANFDYVTDSKSNTTTAARIFVLQQLITKIEDTLEASGASGELANASALTAVINTLSTTALFSNQTSISANSLDTIINAAVEKAKATNTDLSVDTSVLTGIRSVVSNVATAINGSIGSSSSASIQDILNQNQSTITENLKPASYSQLSLSGYSIAQLKGSSATSPLSLSLANIGTALTVGFKLDSVNSTTILNDNVSLAFKVNGSRGTARTEDLNVLIPNVKVSYAADGTVSSAIVLAGTEIEVSSTLANVTSTTFAVANDINIASNGTFTLNDVLAASPRLQGYYNQYIGYLAAGDNAQVTAYVAPTNYLISADLGLQTTAITVNTKTLTGQVLTAYFRLN